MAAVTSLVATPDTGATPNTSGTFTPTAGALLIAIIATSGSTGSAGTLTSSANGITWTNVNVAAFGGGAHTLNIFVANQVVPGSPALMSITWTPTDAGTGTVIFVGQVTGMSRVGLDAVRQSAKEDNHSGAGAPAPVFAAAALTDNPTIGAVGVEGVTANAAVPNASWTERGDTGYSTPSTAAEWCSRDSGFTGTTITWTSAAATVWASMSVELDASAPAAAASLTPYRSPYPRILAG